MSLIVVQIDKAAQRLDFDLAAQIQSLQDRTPADVVTPTEKYQRLQFLDRSLGDDFSIDPSVMIDSRWTL